MRFRAFPKELAEWRRLSRADAKRLSTWIRDGLNALATKAPARREDRKS